MKKQISKIMVKRISSFANYSKELLEKEDSVKANSDSPIGGFSLMMSEMAASRVESMRKSLNLSLMKIFLKIVSGVKKSYRTLRRNPKEPRTEITKESLEEIIAYAQSIGIGSVGFVKIPSKFIFKENAIIFNHAFVLSMEMDFVAMEKAPSKQTETMVLETYRDLGILTNMLAKKLRKKGFAAQASHPLGGSVLYPAIAEEANMGYHGRHGLTIIPEFGPRHRLSAIFTSITNLPLKKENPHKWITDYCKTCGRCIETCPANAIYEEPIIQDNGIITHVDPSKCFPEFNDNHGCSVCIKECMFNKLGYEKIKSIVEERNSK